MKNIFITILSSLLLLLVLPINVCAADVVFNFSSTDIVVNDNLSVSVTINADEPMYAIDFKLNYDPTIFEYVSGGSAGGNGIVKIVDAINGTKKVSYTLLFKALSKGNAVFVNKCSYETLTASKSLTSTSANVTVRDDNVAEGGCGENALWQLNKEGVLTIIGTGSVDNYKLPELEPWYGYKDEVKTVIIEKGIVRIGNNSFSGLVNLEYVKVNNPDLIFGQYVFEPNLTLTIECKKDSSVEKYALENGFEVFLGRCY